MSDQPDAAQHEPADSAAKTEAAAGTPTGSEAAATVPGEATSSEPGHAAVPTAPALGGTTVHFPSRDQYYDLLSSLRQSGFDLLSDLCAVDYLTHPGRPLPPGVTPERFEVAVVLRSVEARQMVRVRVQVPEDDPEIRSAFDLYPGADAMEREAYDMFGIRFVGHPDLTRILMPEEWEGHPLRKDYAVGRVPVQFKEAPGPR